MSCNVPWRNIQYTIFLKVSLHLEIHMPLKCATFLPTHPNKHCPQTSLRTYVHMHYTCMKMGILLKLCVHVGVDHCRHHPRNVTSLKLSPH